MDRTKLHWQAPHKTARTFEATDILSPGFAPYCKA